MNLKTAKANSEIQDSLELSNKIISQKLKEKIRKGRKFRTNAERWFSED